MEIPELAWARKLCGCLGARRAERRVMLPALASGAPAKAMDRKDFRQIVCTLGWRLTHSETLIDGRVKASPTE